MTTTHASSLTSDDPASVLQALNAELLRHDSATLALERWCRVRGAAHRPRIAAQVLHAGAASTTADQRRRLGIERGQHVRYRRVRLSLAGCVLSEADNWYVPERLTAEMNRELESTDIPFGRVIQNLRFRRLTLAADLFGVPQAPEVDLTDGAIRRTPVLRHRALLVIDSGVPVSEVVETYMRAALFIAPRG